MPATAKPQKALPALSFMPFAPFAVWILSRIFQAGVGFVRHTDQVWASLMG